MLFSTDPDPVKSKTKCLHFTKTEREIKRVQLNGNDLPWVKKASHLGNALSVRINPSPVATDTNADLLQKRAVFYDKVHQMKQKFGYCDPRLVCELVRIYGTSFYGSTLWNLNPKEHEQLNLY